MSFNVFLISSITTLITGVLYIPFINLLYKLKMQQPQREKGRMGNRGESSDVYDEIHGHKVGTPIGGGILFSLVYVVGFWLLAKFYNFDIFKTTLLLCGTLVFGLFGLTDDLRKILRTKSLGMRVRYQFLIEFGMAGILTYFALANDLFKVSFLGYEIVGYWILFMISMFTIVFIINAFNIIDGADGLSSGMYLITLGVLYVVFKSMGREVELGYISVIFGALLAFLYFNIRPARVYMGDAGSFSLGAILALFILMNDLLWLFLIFGLVFIVDALSSFLQILSIKFRKKRIIKIAPLHHYFEAVGWPEDKVVFRFWVAHAVLSILALGVWGLV
ncbi:phospho-N-acetylmuramoyl-pentapeptide-transferase [Patescibacteria group bacterium]